MKIRLSPAVLLLSCLCAATLPLLGKGDDWKKAGDFTAGGDGKEVSASGKVPKCKIKCTEGSVVINTIVIREGSRKSSVEVATKIASGEEKEITLNDSENVTGLRIGDSGKGKYEVYLSSSGTSEKKSSSKGKDGWQELGEYSTSGNAREISHSGEVSSCKIKCTEGSVVINTLVVREGGKKTPITVTAHLQKDEEKEISIGEKVNTTGFRISDSGQGKYKVLVK